MVPKVEDQLTLTGGQIVIFFTKIWERERPVLNVFLTVAQMHKRCTESESVKPSARQVRPVHFLSCTFIG